MCRDALTAEDYDNLHLLERTNIDLQVQNSIVPTAYNLARFKVSGHLPSLQVNLSDTKYKSLMRLIDVAIPHFDGDADERQIRPSIDRQGGTFRLPSGLFSSVEPDFDVADTLDASGGAPVATSSTEQEDEFFEAEEGNSQVLGVALSCLMDLIVSFRARKFTNIWLRSAFS